MLKKRGNMSSMKPVLKPITKPLSYKVFCPCTNTTTEYARWASHFCSTKHQEWYVSSAENVNKIIITCPCQNIEYNYKNGHNHFQSKMHRDWEKLDTNRNENVLIVCKCGDVIRYKDRPLHNKIHRLPIFQAQ